MENKTVKLLLYCTKAKPYLVEEYGFHGTNKLGIYYQLFPRKGIHFPILNGKIVAEAECELVEDLRKYEGGYKDNHFYDVLKNACLTTKNLEKYCPVKMGEYKSIYAIYLKNVKPFDEPKELCEYYQNISIKDYEKRFNCEVDLRDEKLNKDKYNKDSYMRVPIKKAPQNMCYLYDKNRNIIAVVISIQSEWLCKILNREKTIEVRKSILNLLKEVNIE